VQVEKPPYWHQGLFLQPQHLQLADLHHRDSIKPFQSYFKPHFWGVISFEIQEAALGNKSFEMRSGEFIFPDGTHVKFPGNAVVAPRSFDDSWLEGEKPFTVYLGLRKWNTVSKNVTIVSDLNDVRDLNTRYVTAADPEIIQDLHAGGPPAQVKRLSYVMRIFWETEKDELDNYYLVPIAQLERNGEDILLSQRFIPPCLTVAASEWITHVIKDVRDQITSRCRQLEEYKSPKEVQTMEFDIGYVVFLLALRSLNRYVPLLAHMTEATHLHPWDVYAAMRQLIGELSTFSEGLNASGERPDGTRSLPSYDHVNLRPCFSAVQHLVAELLDGITVGPGHLIRLEYDGKYYSGNISENMLAPKNRFWLVLRTEASGKTVTDAVERIVKLSAKKSITTLVARAIPGVPLEYFAVPPPGLPRRANSYYYRIDHSSPHWMDVVSVGAVALYWDTAPEDLIAEILVLRS
jgi:type VI secretion system protein ImpJ